jgi:hypothetical protein
VTGQSRPVFEADIDRWIEGDLRMPNRGETLHFRHPGQIAPT